MVPNRGSRYIKQGATIPCKKNYLFWSWMWTKILGNPSKKILKKYFRFEMKTFFFSFFFFFFFLVFTLFWTQKPFDLGWKPFFFFLVFNKNSVKNTFKFGLQSVWYCDSQFSSRAGSHWCWETLEGGHRPSKVGNHWPIVSAFYGPSFSKQKIEMISLAVLSVKIKFFTNWNPTKNLSNISLATLAKS